MNLLSLIAVPEPGRLAILGAFMIFGAVLLRRLLIRTHRTLEAVPKADIQAKFAKLTKRMLPQAQSERIMELVLDLDKLSDISVLIKALAR